MKARSLILVLFVIASLFLVSGCGLTGPGTYREYYGEAIHTYTAPSTPKLEDVPKQFLRDDDTNYVLYLEDAIVAPSSYDTSLLSAFFRTKMCSIVTGAGYQCHDMSGNPITGSLFKGITGASVSDVTGNLVTNVATNTLFNCRRSASGGMHDYYVNIGYPCPAGDTLSVLGRTLVNPPAEYPASAGVLKYCYWPNKDEHLIALNNCDSGTDWRADLGYVYTSPVSGTIKLSRCTFNANGEHTQVIGDCPVGTGQEGSWYILPFCEDTDGGKSTGTKGTVTTPDSDPNKLFEDYCTDTTTVNEFYCDPTVVPRGYADERIVCPSGQACISGACINDPLAYRFNLHKEAHLSEVDRKISYYLEVRNEGPATPSEENIVVITDYLPAGVAVEAVSPAPSVQSGRTLKWFFDGFDNRQEYRYDSKLADEHSSYTIYRSNGRFAISLNVTVDSGISGTLVNEANVTAFGVLKGTERKEVDISAGTGPTPTTSPNLVIVGKDTNIAGHGGDVNFIETPYCPRGTRKFGEIFEFHAYNNEYGRRWAFCSRPDVYGQINTCSVEDSSDVNPWTSSCEPALCPDGMTAFGGLIKHGYYVRPGLNTYKYINMYSRICLSTTAFNAGTVKTCGNQNGYASEDGQCDSAMWQDDSDGLVCPSGQSQVQNGLVADPVTSAHDIAGNNGAPIWEFRYNNVCADFKALTGSVSAPWDNTIACAANTDCKSGYCDSANKVCAVAPVAPSANMVITTTDVYIPGHGGDLSFVPNPDCPFGTSTIGQIHEFHGYNNEVGRKWNFCTKPGITGEIKTCSTDDSSDANPWTSVCDPGVCSAGTTALSGLIKHGEYVRISNSYKYINRYSRICLSNNALDAGTVVSCGNQEGYKGETGECDAANWKDDVNGLSCPTGQTPIDVVISDPVTSAHDIASGNGAPMWEFRYNRVCVDFKDQIQYCGDNIVQSSLGEQCEASANCASGQVCQNCICVSSLAPPWANGYSCTANTDCISGYCNPTTHICAAAPGTPTSYKVSIPPVTVPASFTNFATGKSVLVGTCTDNGHVATALGTAGCAALTSGKAVLLLTHSPYRLVIAAYDSTGVAVAINVLRNGANYNVHGPRVDITYSGSSIGVTFPHCSDGTRNYDETGTDCGGSCPACAGAAPTCTDHTQNQGETGVDCGGPCTACTSYPPATTGGTPSGSSGGGGRRNVPATTTADAGSAECYDDWICTAWTVCSAAGLQTRTCGFNDYPDCKLIIQKPSEQQSCKPAVVAPPVVVPVENCFDGMQNQNEEGIDCGGMCAPCPGKASWLVPVIIVLVIAALAIGFLIYYDKFLKKPDVLSPLRKYVKDARGKSIPDARIKQILQNQGWSQSDIGKVMGK